MVVQRSRLEARVPPDVQATPKRAAEIEGRNLTDFVVAAASAAAPRTIEQAQIIRLDAESSAFVAALLSETSDANAAMQRARDKHRSLVGPL